MPFKIISKKEYQKMQEKIKQLEIDSLKKNASIDLLQSQINPHFLYNSLESIRGLAVINDVLEIADIAESLANFFRYSIDAKKNVITLKEELESVENYMSIQAYRFEDRFNLSINHDLDDEIISLVKIPKLIFQPLVENSIKHAFNNMKSNCNIEIKIKKFGETLKINVKDNGQGISIDDLMIINRNLNLENLESNGENNSLGIALANVKKRIEIFFGPKSSFNIKSLEKVGTDIEMFLPIIYKDGAKWDY